MVRRFWPTYLAIAGLVTVGLGCLMALGLKYPARSLELTKPPVARYQAKPAPASSHNPLDPVEAGDAVTARVSSGS